MPSKKFKTCWKCDKVWSLLLNVRCKSFPCPQRFSYCIRRLLLCYYLLIFLLWQTSTKLPQLLAVKQWNSISSSVVSFWLCSSTSSLISLLFTCKSHGLVQRQNLVDYRLHRYCLKPLKRSPVKQNWGMVTLHVFSIILMQAPMWKWYFQNSQSVRLDFPFLLHSLCEPSLDKRVFFYNFFFSLYEMSVKRRSTVQRKIHGRKEQTSSSSILKQNLEQLH